MYSKDFFTMTSKFEGAMLELGKVNALVNVYDCCYLDIAVKPEHREKASEGANVFLALKDCVERLTKEMEELRLEMDAAANDLD